MSEQPKTRPKVPEGKARFVTTRQKEPNEKGFVKMDVLWNVIYRRLPFTFSISITYGKVTININIRYASG